MPDADDASHGEHGQASDERQLRNIIAAGARAADMPGWAGSSKLAAVIARGAVAQHDLALLLSRKGLHEEADAHLRALGMRFKLSPAILSPSPCDLGPRSKRARLDDGGGIPLVLDNVLPSALHSALKQASFSLPRRPKVVGKNSAFSCQRDPQAKSHPPCGVRAAASPPPRPAPLTLTPTSLRLTPVLPPSPQR